MVNFLKLLLYRLGSSLFWLGVVFAPMTLAIFVYELVSIRSAIEVEAEVWSVDELCILTSKSGGGRSKTSEPMDCAEADDIKEANPQTVYRTRKQLRSYLVYPAPDGKQHHALTDISRHDGRVLQAGDRLPLLIDPENPKDYRRIPVLSDLIIPGALFGGGIVSALLGWLLRRLGRGGSLPPPIWTRFRRRAA